MSRIAQSQTFRAAIESEMTAIEEARNALPHDSHLRSLCDLAVERLGFFLSPREAAPTGLPAQRAVPAANPTSPTQIESNKKGRLAGTIRRIAADSLHPTGWMFVTKLSEMPLDATLDPSNVMNAAERLEGQQVLLTGYFAEEVNMRLVADSIEPQ
jgi:hypothetical protein